jgi:hypothetical protein
VEQMLAKMMGVTPEMLREITINATNMIGNIAADMKIMKEQLNSLEEYIKKDNKLSPKPKLITIDKKEGTNG